ncbi:SsgA family sporulation/cell division regulator [Streptomyces sp. NPDC001985]|uniref:SsgA family sporulation/cell division regulator n=1 Tax=Streptomyces sp. NPDC001985 TaxID=3154406 RepID=UPI00332D2D24
MIPTVEQPIPAQLISDAPRPVPLTVWLTYGAHDPLAVHMTFSADMSLNGTGVTWTFARALLEAGLRAPSGVGDVRVRPCGRGRTAVELRSSQGVALLRFSTGRLRHFLLRTYAAVPADLEAGALDIDGTVAALLSDARDWQD